VIAAASALPADALIVCGSMRPRILALAGPAHADRYLYLVESPASVTGRPLLFVPGAEEENRARNGLDLRALGGGEIPAR